MIILLGLAGTGKSSQGQFLAEKYGWVWLSAGQILRDSGQFAEILARGDLVDSATVGKMVFAAVDEHEQQGKKVILDGYPRGSEQATALVANPELLVRVEAVFCLEVPRTELKRRLLLRGREDDTEVAIDKRLDDGEELVCSVVEILEKSGCRVARVNGEGTRAEVLARLTATVEKMGLNRPAPESG